MARLKRLASLATCAAIALGLAGCGESSDDDTDAASEQEAMVGSIRECLQEAGYDDLTEPNPGQVAVDLSEDSVVTLTVEADAGQAADRVAAAEEGAGEFGAGIETKGEAVGSVAVVSGGPVDDSEFESIRACASGGTGATGEAGAEPSTPEAPAPPAAEVKRARSCISDQGYTPVPSLATPEGGKQIDVRAGPVAVVGAIELYAEEPDAAAAEKRNKRAVDVLVARERTSVLSVLNNNKQAFAKLRACL